MKYNFPLKYKVSHKIFMEIAQSMFNPELSIFPHLHKELIKKYLILRSDY